jgi:hypothetical protein
MGMGFLGLVADRNTRPGGTSERGAMTFEESIAKIDRTLQSYLEEIDRRGEAIAQLRASNAKLIAEAKQVIRAWEGGSGMGTFYEMTRAISSIRAAISHVEESAS